ncbi:MAG: hypothetical protein EOO01_08245 [Chitinophagaceae bacterium]|nr:MAG: hypothetical protein EOO01_08245 [Chitinophagaceae bacterium]
MLRIFVLIGALMMSLPSPAQHWSVIYIQGDKELPFYVKLEGEMLPRYGKNYCIIPQLAAGPVRLQILFQQNLYPAQQYTIQVPEAGERAFLLTKNEGQYSLYDIHSRVYLKPGEKDELPATAAIDKTKAEPEAGPVTAPKVKEKKPETTTKPVAKQPDIKQAENEPRFMKDLVLNDRTEREEDAIVLRNSKAAKPAGGPAGDGKGNETVEEVNLESNTAPIFNSDCPAPMSMEDFGDILNTAKSREQGDRLVSYLIKKTEGNCYTTRQVFELADLIDEQALIYLYLKRIYPRVTDQHNFHLLEPYLFETEEWAKAFRLIH